VRVYQKKDGTDGYSLTCRIDNLEFVAGGKGEPKDEPKPGINQLDDDIQF
jgi:hypothetical protein